MKNKLLLTLMSLFTVSVLVGCGRNGGGENSQNTDSKPTQSEIITETSETSKPGSTTSVETSTETEIPTSSEEPKPENFVDYVKDGTVKLGLDYNGKDFFEQGVAQVSLYTPIDGDTAHFKMINKPGTDVIKARFYGIDTPESTGTTEPWGYGASRFTKTKLKAANENGTIVVSTALEDYGRPSPDSTGSRYMSLVWINETKKNASLDELYCLNLWIVQEGWSRVRNAMQIERYADTFYAAERQAKAFKYNLWSGQPDPEFPYGEHEEVSLLDLKIATEKQIEWAESGNATAENKPVHPFHNKKVRFYATVTGYYNNTLHVQRFYTESEGARYPEGEYAGINIFAGPGGIVNREFHKPGTYVEILGLCKDGQFGFQITDTVFPVVDPRDHECKIVLSAEENDKQPIEIFNYTGEELSNHIDSGSKQRNDAWNGRVELKDNVIVTRAYKDDKGFFTLNVKSLSGKDLSFTVFVTFPYAPDPTTPWVKWSEEADWIGQELSVKGVLAWRVTRSMRSSWGINPCSSKTDISHVEA